MSNKIIRLFGRVSGRVQGVGFRLFVQKHAQQLGVTGWVRNMDDGTVTMELQGTKEKLDRMEDTIHKGNIFINVEKLELENIEPIDDEHSFEVRY